MPGGAVETVLRHIDATNRRDVEALLAVTHDPIGWEARRTGFGEPMDFRVTDRSHDGVRAWVRELDGSGRHVHFHCRDTRAVRPDVVVVEMAVDTETGTGGAVYLAWLVYRLDDGKVDLIIDCADEEAAVEAAYAASRHARA